MATTTPYPVRVDARLDPSLSRWLWLVKWLLAIPHYVVLFFLWIAFAALSVVAFFAILFTGKYPRPIFDFTVGVLRWSWRVTYYAYGALGTDRYPPFTLADVPDYPAHLEIAYPEHLSRGLVLVKWWLLAIPHYLIVAVFLGGGPYLSWQFEDNRTAVQGAGLIGLLVLVAAVVLLVTGRYPRGIFDLVLGLNRWVLRVAAYAGLMTDTYPPFRLDTGEHDPAVLDVTPPPKGPGMPQDTKPPERPWTAGRLVMVVLGSLLLLSGVSMMPAGGVALWFDQAARDSNGFLMADTHRYTADGYALSTEPGELRLDGPAWVFSRAIGEFRVEGTAADGQAVFIGVGPTTEVEKYLATIEHSTVSGLDVQPFDPVYRHHTGTAPTQPPESETFWLTAATGPGTQSITWPARAGNWTVVVMNADGSRPVSADARAGVTLPWLDDLAGWLIGLGLLLAIGGALFIALSVRRPTPNPEGTSR